MTELFSHRTCVKTILVTLSEVEKASGNADLANSLCNQAREVVNDIATHAGEMRDVFLDQPAVIQRLRGN